jgi:hypothetical protein
MEQAVRDGMIERNPARVTGWQSEYQLAEDELDDPRSLALPDWDTLTRRPLRHTGLTWMADAGVPVHVLRRSPGTGHCPRPSATCTQMISRSPMPGML